MFVEDNQLGVNFLEVVSAVLPKGSVAQKLVKGVVQLKTAKKTAEEQKRAADELQQSISRLEKQKQEILAAIEVKKQVQASSGFSLSNIPSWIFIAIPLGILMIYISRRK